MAITSALITSDTPHYLSAPNLLDMITLMLISIAVGLLGSLTGLGGASILTPILVLLGFPVKEAVACGMIVIIATSSGAAVSFVKDKIANVKLAMYL